MRNFCAALLLTLTLAYSASGGIMETGSPSAGIMEADFASTAATTPNTQSSSDELSVALLQIVLTIVQSVTP